MTFPKRSTASMPLLAAAFALLLSLLCCSAPNTLAAAWQLPSLEVGRHKEDDPLIVTADSFRSPKALVPYNFYQLPMCKPEPSEFKKLRATENLGQVLLGNRRVPTRYEIKAGQDEECKVLCASDFTRADILKVRNMIKNRYMTHLQVDELPVLSPLSDFEGSPLRLGYPLGVRRMGGASVFYNHITFTIMYVDDDGKPLQVKKKKGKQTTTTTTATPTEDDTGLDADSTPGIAISRIIVTPRSVLNNEGGDCESAVELVLPAKSSEVNAQKITFTYSVRFVLADGDAADITTRWDIYVDLMRGNWKVKSRSHWITSVGALFFALVLSGGVAAVIARTVRRDLLQYTEEATAQELKEERGWKLVRGDVFRPPSLPVVFSGVIGSGAQVLTMLILTSVLLWIGVAARNKRGRLLSLFVGTYYVSSIVAGTVSALMLRFFKQPSWGRGVAAANLLSGSALVWFLSINLIHWSKHSTSAIPFKTLLFLVVLYALVSLPLSVVGLFIGFACTPPSPAAKPSLIPRLIPANSPAVTYSLIAGAVPFCASFAEVVLIMGSFWQGEAFYQLGFLFLAGALTVIISGECSIIATYATLVNEDYRWWWVSFGSGASFGVFVFLYGVVYLAIFLEISTFWSILLYLGYTLGLATICGLVMGTVGFVASAVFVSYIYSAVKAD